MNENQSIMASVKGMEMQRWATFTVKNLKLNWHKVFGLWKAHFSGKVVNMDSSENKRTFPISINTEWYQGLADHYKKHCLITLISRHFLCSLQRISRSTFQTSCHFGRTSKTPSLVISFTCLTIFISLHNEHNPLVCFYKYPQSAVLLHTVSWD